MGCADGSTGHAGCGWIDPLDELRQTGEVSDALFPLDEPPAGEFTLAGPAPMTDDQRAAIRSHFHELGISDAKAQFAVVKELTGTTIQSVRELSGLTAHRLIGGLRKRVQNAHKVHTGNAWDDREEDTWIDRL